MALTVLVCCLPAAAQHDIVGFWGQPAVGTALGSQLTPMFGFEEDAVERADGPPLDDYLGIPMNAELRGRALSYNSSLLVVPEHQCMPHPSTYSFWGPTLPYVSIREQVNENLEVVAYQVGGTFRRADRTIYLDGRPHPPVYAPHTWAGFTTGKWQGNTLVTTTTHIKWAWIRRNGVASSDQATVTTFYTRNGDVLTITWMVYDPLYLTETYTKSSDFILVPRVPSAQIAAPPAPNTGGIYGKCIPSEEVIRSDPHFVPHYLPWANPFTHEVSDRLGIPAEAVMGGAETAYPEYQERLRRK
jgi:hypothetical protein